MRQAESLRHARHQRRFLARFGAESVVDRQHSKVWLSLAFRTPLGHEVEQRHAVGAPGHGKRKPGKAGEGRESGSRFAR
jgi:hypothetical protein